MKRKELKRNHIVNQFVKEIIHDFFIQNYHSTETVTKNINNPLLRYDDNSKKHVHFGPEGIGKSYSSLTLGHVINNKSGKVFVISNSNKQSYERFDDIYRIQNHIDSSNDFLKIDSVIVKSANEMIRELLHGNNKYVKNILLGKINKNIELIPYMINENTNTIVPTNIDGLPKYVSHISDEDGYIVKYDMLINKLLFDIKKIFTSSKKNKKTIYDIFKDLSIDNSYGILLLYKVNNSKSIKINDIQYGKIIFDRSGEIRNKLQYSDIINQTNIDNDKPIILNISEYFDDDSEYYVSILSNRCLRNFQKSFENNEKIVRKLNDLKFLIQNDDKLTYYFMEYYTFMNNILIPIYTKFTNAIRKLDEKDSNTKVYENIIENCLKFFENVSIIMDETPHNLTNFLSLQELDTTSLNLNNIMETKKPETNTIIYNHYYRNGKFKGERLVNIFNNWDEYIKIAKKLNIKHEIKEKLLKKLQYIKDRSKLNILLTIFDHVNVSTSELTPFVTLTLYGFDPFLYTSYQSTINHSKNNELIRLKESFEKIDKQIKDGSFENRKFFKNKPVVELQFISDPRCKPINNNFKNVNTLISYEKLDLENKREFLSVGNNLYNTDITFESLKGSNNERDRNNSQKIIVNDSLNISPYIKKIVGVCSPNNPTKMLKSTLLFKESLECFLNNDHPKLSKYPKIKEIAKEFYDWISKDKESLIDIDIVLSFMQYADNINQVIGRFGYPRIIDDNVKIPHMKFLIPILKRKNYDLTYLLVDIVKERYPNFTEYSVLENIDIYSIREQITMIQNKYGNTIKSIEKFLLSKPLEIDNLKYTEEYKDRVNTLIEYLKKNRYLKPEYLRSIYIIMKSIFNSIADELDENKFEELAEEFKLSYFYQKIRYKNISKARKKLEERLSQIYNQINELKNSDDSKSKLKIRQLLESTLPKVFKLDYENGQDVIRLNTNISNKEEIIKQLKKDEKKKLKRMDSKLLFSKYLYNLKLNIFISLLSSINKISMFDEKIDNLLTKINNEIFNESLLYFSNGLIIQIATNILGITFEYKEGLILSDELRDKLLKIDKEFEHLLSYPNINLSTLKEKLKNIKNIEDKIVNQMKKKITNAEIKVTPNIDGTFLLNVFKNKQDPFRYLTKYTTLNKFLVNRKEIIDHFDFNNKSLDTKEEIVKDRLVRFISKKVKEDKLLIYDISKNYSNHIFMPFILSKEKEKLSLDNLVKNQTIINDYIFDCMFKIQYTRELDLKLYSNVPHELLKNMVLSIYKNQNDEKLEEHLDKIKKDFIKTKPALGQTTTNLHTYSKINIGNRLNRKLTKEYLLNDDYIKQNIAYAFNYTDQNYKTHALRLAFNLCKTDNRKKIINLDVLSNNILNTFNNIINKFKTTKDINYLVSLIKVGLFKISDNSISTFKPLNDILPIINDIIEPEKINKLKEFYISNF